MMPPSSKIKPSSHILGLNMVAGGSNSRYESIADGNPINKVNSMMQNKLNVDTATRAFGPIAIIGGTVSIYTAALSHSSTTLTPISVLYLLLLALNYSIMPRISKKYVSPKTNKESVALVEEVVKMTMGVTGFILTECTASSSIPVTNSAPVNAAAVTATSLGIGGVLKTYLTNIQSATSNWSFHSSLLAAGLPSTLYAIQGVLTYTSYQNLDSVTFNGLTQIKTLSAALCCYLVLGKVQSKIQIIALALLSLSTLVFQGMLVDEFISYLMRKDKSKRRSRTKTIVPKKAEKGEAVPIEAKKRFFLGIVPCLAATFLSGLAGAFSQRSLQTVVGSMERNAFFYSAEISFFSAVCLLFSMISKKITTKNHALLQKSKSDKNKEEESGVGGYFDHWSWRTFVPIFVKATGGILTALVHKHSGSVMKGFSLVLGLVFSALLQTVLDGKDLTVGQMAGTALVLLSSWLHFTNPAL